MEIANVGSKALANIKESEKAFVAPKPKKKVLDEETYTETVEKIIVRDFYPDLPRLHAQNEYLDALKINDVCKLREIHRKYGPKMPSVTPNIYATPATFETPEVTSNQTPVHSTAGKSTEEGLNDKEAHPTHNPEPKKETKKDSDLRLDKFLSKVTSEDNASFADIMAESEQKRRLKHEWLYSMEDECKQEIAEQQALPSMEVQAIQPSSNTSVKLWNYTNRNSVMYNPDGAALTAAERIETAKGNPREIMYGNTRLDKDTFDKQRIKEITAQSASAKAQLKMGKIGHDGKELISDQTPQINGFGFVATPSPAPGVEESPFMTWGEIDGTPFRLDPANTPAPHRTPGASFRMPAVPRREEIGLMLAENVSKSHRAKKEAAMKRVSSRLASPSPKFGSASKTERLQNMSPAAQRLAHNRLGIRTHTDKALRQSYTPSPSHRLVKTPTPTHSSKIRTPKTGRATPRSGSSTPLVAAHTPDLSTSLTDNLLNLPKRARAEDFF